MKIEITNNTTIEELRKIIQEYNELGFNCFIKGIGDGTIKIVIEKEFENE